MTEGLEPFSLIIANLINPREKFFGTLLSLSPGGVTLRGINLDSFEDWIRQIARGEEPDIAPVTMFIPLFRVERIFLDEPVGAIPSYSDTFERVAGQPIRKYLGILDPGH